MKMTKAELRGLIRQHLLNEVGSFSSTGPDSSDVLSINQIMALRNAGFDVAGRNPQNLTDEEKSALADAGVPIGDVASSASNIPDGLATKAARRLGVVGTGELGPADFEAVKIELVEDGIATEAEMDALDYDEVLRIRGLLDDDGDFEDVAPEGGTFDGMGDDDGDADDDGVPDALENTLANLVANAGERLTVGQIVEFMLDALADEMHGGFPTAEVIASVESWVHNNSADGQPMTESKSTTRWEHLAGLLKD